MPDSASEGWQELQTTSRRQCPKLFYSVSTKEQSLTLLLTDLISIWECSLDRYDILAAAARQQTSIDPSVSTDQFEVLLSKIRKSLGEGENSVIRDGRGNSQTLLLRTRIDLPRPLRPLEWAFTLDPQRASELAERILRPSLHEVFVSQNKINSLLGIIKDKDHIISRLLDRVGNSAVDLSLVFPGITGFASRKGGHVSAADANKHVPGMASFDEKVWTRQFANDDGYEGADRTGLSNLVRGCEKCFAHSKAEHENWVKDLPSTDKSSQIDTSNKRIGSPSTKVPRKKPDSDSESTGDEFERQATPPHLKSKDTPKATHETTEDEETEDDEPAPKRTQPSTIGGLGRRNATKAFGASKRSPDQVVVSKTKSPPRRRASTASTETETASEDDDAAGAGKEPRPPIAPRNKSSHSTQKSKLGALKPRKVSPSSSPSPPPSKSRLSTSSAGSASDQELPSRNSRVAAARASKTPEQEEEEDGEETDDLNGKSSTPSPSPPPPPPQAKPSTPAHERRRLGRLGGKKQATPSTSASASPPETSKGEKMIPETQSPAKRRLGRLGGLRKRERETTTSPQARDKPPGPVNEDDSHATTTPSPSPSPSAASPSSRQRQRRSPPPSTRTKPAEEPKKEETAEEAASRRRMELKRTIAAQDGGKKKRRF
ncbi:uncharacterized protein PV07_01623 [Cladophialophora immunda]|uniref:Non-homologous end-joining factor 1 n=1 Tax=Cladophialophora immunda TaxID=569365 RepID=A0A0D2A3J9_9EURO|nr:uncharacterized protein PV07_01623 [Cladophialophora immunda]KIW34876.1 hypothetical protein PV07_01623 [Cladophialophora immunda]OQV00884.1 hypothetical protein CLAIMM_06322 [Cladophialophora immunda]